MNGKFLTLIIKATFDCNLRCSYCYEGHRPQGQHMGTETVGNLISKFGQYAMSVDEGITFIWHGGEPLLAGKGFYEHVMEKQKALGPSFRYENTIQTNGILLNDAFADFLTDNKFGVGVSLDGPPVIHDAQRVIRAGIPSFNKVFSALVRLDDRGQPCAALAIFTRNTMDHLDEFYEFFRDREIDVLINPLLIMGRAEDSEVEDLRVSPKEFGEGMSYLFDRWIDEKESRFKMDPFYRFVQSLVTGSNGSCHFNVKQCFDYYKIFTDGSVHLCGFQDYSKHVLGNVNADEIDTILNSPEREKYRLLKAAVKETCGPCEHFDMCHGGCTYSAYSRQKSLLDRNYYCEGYRMLFSHIKATVPKRVPPNLRPLLVHA